MEFYIVEHVQSGISENNGIDLDKFSKMIKVIGKDERFQIANSIEPFNIIYLENDSFASNKGLEFNANLKKECFALVAPGNTFEIKNKEEQIFYARVSNSHLHISDNLENLQVLENQTNVHKSTVLRFK